VRAGSGSRGGTGEIVRFAIRTGVPVLWLPSDGTDPPRLARPLRPGRWYDRHVACLTVFTL
jgi:hypothetical protein